MGPAVGRAAPRGASETPGLVLALGGGGAKCFAQIGVLRALERRGLRVRGVAGTSAGALVGAAYAAGRSPADIERAYAGLHRRGRLRRAPRRAGPGLFDLRDTMAVVDELIGDAGFGDLALPLVLTSVDLDDGQLVPLREGRVRDAVRAAIAIPGLFTPARLGGRALVDGGVLDPIPVGLARELAPGLPALAVVLTPPLVGWDEHPARRSAGRVPGLRLLLRLRLAAALGVFVRAAETTHRQLAEDRLTLAAPELVVRPEVPHAELHGPFDPAPLVAAGERAADAALDAWRGPAEPRLLA